MKKQNGFTLVELLAVIVILGILMVVAVPAVLSFSQNMKNKMYCNKVDSAIKSAQLYGQDNIDTISKKNLQCTIYQGATNSNKTVDKCTVITIQALLNKGYISKEEGQTKGVKDDFVDPRDFTSLKQNKVLVYIRNKRIYAKFVHSRQKDATYCEDTYYTSADGYVREITS